jgi:eukaryotic-like serine/threonine-protein kinase
VAPPDDEPPLVLDVAQKVADCSAVNWAEVESLLGGTEAGTTVRQLRALEVLGAYHRYAAVALGASLADRPPLVETPVPMNGAARSAGPERWGEFELREQIGQGAFGQVYRAWDIKLSREVALKLSRDEGAHFEAGSRVIREAQLMARVRHRNVVTIYGADRIDGRLGLWMELIRGRTLEQVLKDDGPFGPREVALIGAELCRAIDAVHRAGLVHRDVKAQNVMREWGGRLVLTDFGTGEEWQTGQRALTPEMVGTPLYTAPEVLEGEPASRSSDLYSLGVLLFRLLTGQYPVSGSTLEDVRDAHRARRRTKLRDVQPDVPPGLVLVVENAMALDPRERPTNAGVFEARLASVLAGPHLGGDRRAAQLLRGELQAGSSSGPGRRSWATLGAVAVLACLATALAWFAADARRTPVVPPFVRLTLPLAPAEHLKMDSTFSRPLSTALAVSPDGRRVAFVGQVGSTRQLYVRDLAAATAVGLPDTDGAYSPAFSPDGAWIAFAAGGRIQKVDLGTRQVVTVADVGRHPRPPAAPPDPRRYDEPTVYGLAWRGTDALVYGSFGGGLWQVPATGGLPVLLTTLATEAEFAHRLPHVLPDGDRVLFTALDGVSGASTEIVAVVLSTGERRVLLTDAADGRVVADRLVFMRRGQLMAVAFDPERLAVQGDPVPLVDGVMQSLFGYRNQLNVGAGQYAFSADGRTLVYVPGSVLPDESRSLVWVDKRGRESPTGLAPGAYMRPDIASGRAQVLFTCWSGGRAYVCWFDLERQVVRPITEGWWPLWTRDGRHAVFSRLSATGVFDLHRMPVDSSAEPQLLRSGTRDLWAGSWSPDGSVLAYVETSATTDNDIWVLPHEGEARPFLQTTAREDHPEFSPDGRWIAYASDESGREEVYLTPYPSADVEVRVSAGGGTGPVWSPDGRRLYYVVWEDPGLAMMEVDVLRTHPHLTLSAPRQLFSGNYVGLASVRGYDISDDGTRFLLVRRGATRAPITHLQVVLNWTF